jgi:hypothetical protein
VRAGSYLKSQSVGRRGAYSIPSCSHPASRLRVSSSDGICSHLQVARQLWDAVRTRYLKNHPSTRPVQTPRCTRLKSRF